MFHGPRHMANSAQEFLNKFFRRCGTACSLTFTRGALLDDQRS
jgi:hypothetical protein